MQSDAQYIVTLPSALKYVYMSFHRSNKKDAAHVQRPSALECTDRILMIIF